MNEFWCRNDVFDIVICKSMFYGASRWFCVHLCSELFDFGFDSLEDGFEGHVDDCSSVVGAGVEHPEVENEAESVEAGDPFEDERKWVIDGVEESKDDPIGQPHFLLILVVFLDCLSKRANTFQDM